jgi:hypothetical protein
MNKQQNPSVSGGKKRGMGRDEVAVVAKGQIV